MRAASTTDAPDPDFAARHARYPEAQIRKILTDTRTIALVGASANPARPSWIVLKYLLDRGYAVTPVNPGLAGQDLLGRRVAASLAEIPEPIDMVEIFRNSAEAGSVTDEALALDPLPRFIWMQLSVRDAAAAARAEAKGVAVIMNRCPRSSTAASRARSAGRASRPGCSRPNGRSSPRTRFSG